MTQFFFFFFFFFLFCCFNFHNDVSQVVQRNVSTVAHTRHRGPSLNDAVEGNPPIIPP